MMGSNEMMEIVSTVVPDLEEHPELGDITVDWNVSCESPLLLSQASALSGSIESDLNTFVWVDQSQSSANCNSTSRVRTTKHEDLSLMYTTVLKIFADEVQKVQSDNEARAEQQLEKHKVVCQKLDEIHTSFKDIHSILHHLENRAIMQRATESAKEYKHLKVDKVDDDEKSNCSDHENNFDESVKYFEGYNSAEQEKAQVQPEPPKIKSSTSTSSKSSYTSISAKPVTDSAARQASISEQGASKPSNTFSDFASTDEESLLLEEAVERAYLKDEEPPPQASSHNTILCLDVSESMNKNGAFKQMIDLVNEFLNGIEDLLNDTGLEENIGVVTFGGNAKVIQNLTNDFNLVRDALDGIQFGGRSPFVQALLVSYAAFVEKAGIVSLSGVYDIRPRIICITDGHPTECTADKTSDHPHNPMNVRSNLTKLMLKWSTKFHKVQPLVFIPVGQHAEKDLLKSMAKLCQGIYMEPSDAKKLCTYFLFQEIIGKTVILFRNQYQTDERVQSSVVHNCIKAIWPIEMQEEQINELVLEVIQELKTPKKKYRSKTSNMEEVYENINKVKSGKMLPLGTRVIRGPDWHWDDQDSYGPGTVIQHSKKEKELSTWVSWDAGGYNRYAYGDGGLYHISNTGNHLRLLEDDGNLKIGMVVKRSADWVYTDPRLQNVNQGIIIRKSRKTLMVRWDNGEFQVVRNGQDGKFDVQYCNPDEIQTETVPLVEISLGKAQHELMTSEADFEDGQWQWQSLDGTWHHYEPTTNATIEQAYKKKPNGSCIINREGTNRRILFRRMTEKDVDSGMECIVKRISAQ